MTYIPPMGNLALFNFMRRGYVVPAGNAADMEFRPRVNRSGFFMFFR
jgi:hypothetical protein